MRATDFSFTNPGRHRYILYGDLPAIVRNLTILMGAAVAVLEALLFFRLFHQLGGNAPDAGPASWLYSLAGGVVGYFRGFEAGPTMTSATVIELSLIVAIWCCFAAGVALAVMMFLASRYAEEHWPNPFVFHVGQRVPEPRLRLREPTQVFREVSRPGSRLRRSA